MEPLVVRRKLASFFAATLGLVATTVVSMIAGSAVPTMYGSTHIFASAVALSPNGPSASTPPPGPTGGQSTVPASPAQTSASSQPPANENCPAALARTRGSREGKAKASRRRSGGFLCEGNSGQASVEEGEVNLCGSVVLHDEESQEAQPACPGARRRAPSRDARPPTDFGRRAPLAFAWGWKRAQDKLPHLLAFVGEECEYCRRMQAVEKAVEALLSGVKIHRLEVWHNALNFELLQELDRGGKCGGLPFYFNMRTLQWICGATTKTNLLAWAADQPCRPHEPPALQAEDLEVLNRRTGALARMMRRVDKMRHDSEKAVHQTLLKQRQEREREVAEERRRQRERDHPSKRKE
ncbi:hypothetical protein BESB_072280 [Besnoitia besnoiti]|uniref:Uncharacterized protein n=1 Tax=Besnoitia besnoiti TaxID=94643 RepID=A0A2A9MDQ1_BESBE|nr:uncharacterized protein BESB_072280 [Besnoitia besnoiti]PFH34076.1 hypothetical protein BESB_072280 [Besnoitia besnoiti]